MVLAMNTWMAFVYSKGYYMNQTDKSKVTVVIVQDLDDGVNDVTVYADPTVARRETSITIKRLVKEHIENYPTECNTKKAWSVEIHTHLQREEYDQALEVYNRRCFTHGFYIDAQEQTIK